MITLSVLVLVLVVVPPLPFLLRARMLLIGTGA